jgi:opacity protein-like surface antigen
MKKIIAVLVVFALFAGSAFAADIGVNVNASSTLLSGSSKEDSDITTKYDLNLVRISAAGGDDNFGGWFRMSGTWEAAGLAWWKPVDFLKVQLGWNPDGHWGQDFDYGWGFYRAATSDFTDLTDNGENSWGGGIYTWNGGVGQAFPGGGTWPVMLEITPIDLLTINIGLPFDGRKIDELFDGFYLGVGVNPGFGNIRVEYKGEGEKKGKIAASYGMPISILHFAVGLTMPYNANDGAPKQPIYAGLGVRAGINDSFGIKLRTYATLGGEDSDPLKLTADLLPYFTITDTFRAFIGIGFAMASYDDSDLNKIGWRFNPWVEIGQEWGPRFFAGFNLKNDGVEYEKDKTETTWKVVIGIGSSF